MLNMFTIEKNTFLKSQVAGFYSADYVGYYNPGNPSYLNVLKNTFASYGSRKLMGAANDLANVLIEDLPSVIKVLGRKNVTVCVMPRAKRMDAYQSSQLLFSKTVSDVVSRMNSVVDGSNFITRSESTRTTHLRHDLSGGSRPYVGITKDTCTISKMVRGQDILLVDDVYTKTVNVNEDAIQALFDRGANSVTLYVVAKTVKRY